MQIAKITLSIPHFKTHFKEARGHTAILLWSHHASSPLWNRQRSPVRGDHLHPVTGTWAAFCQLYIACPRAGEQSSCSSAQNIPSAKNKLPLHAGQLPVRLLQAAPIQPHWWYPQQPEEWTAHPWVFLVPGKHCQPKPGVNTKRPGWALGGKAVAAAGISATALWTGQPSWHHLRAAHASKCLRHFPSGAGNPCLSVLIIASRAHRPQLRVQDFPNHPEPF